MYHIQKSNSHQVYSMVVHILVAVFHRTVGKVEEVRWVAEMVAGGDWEDKSEKEHNVVPLDGDPWKIAVEVDFQMNAVAVVVVDEAVAESIDDEGSADIVDAEVPLVEDVAAELKAVGIADLEFPEIEQVVASMDLSEEQLGLGSESIDLEVELEVANFVEEVEEVH
jgi:hypothetical protein